VNTTTAVKTKLVDELHAAETALRSAEITLRVIESNVNAGNKSVPSQEAALEKDPPAYQSDVARMYLRKAKDWLAGEEAKLSGAGAAVEDAKRTVAFVQSKIASDPVYGSVLAKRREFITRGVELARRAWSVPLLQVCELVRQYEAIADDEANFVLRENSRLAQAGLPELVPVLGNYRHALPEMITRMDIATLANEAVKLITEMASR
jgi:hypothetical protein